MRATASWGAGLGGAGELDGGIARAALARLELGGRERRKRRAVVARASRGSMTTAAGDAGSSSAGGNGERATAWLCRRRVRGEREDLVGDELGDDWAGGAGEARARRARAANATGGRRAGGAGTGDGVALPATGARPSARTWSARSAATIGRAVLANSAAVGMAVRRGVGLGGQTRRRGRRDGEGCVGSGR